MVDWKQIFIVMAIIGFSATAIILFLDDVENNYDITVYGNQSNEYDEVYDELKGYSDIAEEYTRETEQIAREDEGITLLSGASAVSKGIITMLKIIFRPITNIGLIADISRLIGFPIWVGQLLTSIIVITIISIFLGAILRWRMKG